MPIHSLNLLLMYRLKEGTLSQRRRIDYPSLEVVFVGNKRIVLNDCWSPSGKVLTATGLGRGLVTGREGCLPRSSQKVHDPYERFTC